MIKIHLVVLLLALMFSATAKAGDNWAGPKALIFSSSDGAVAVKVVPTVPDESTATVFRLRSDGTQDGTEEVLWSGKINTPLSVFLWHTYRNIKHPVSLVTLDTWGRVGYEHALVVYDERGRVLIDAKLEDLLTPEEIKKHVIQSQSSRWWRNNATTEFDNSGDSVKFIIKLSWGKVITADLDRGKIIITAK